MCSAVHFCFQVRPQDNIKLLTKYPACEVISMETSEYFQDVKLYIYISVSLYNSLMAPMLMYRFFSSRLPPFCRVADTASNVLSVWLCMITAFYKGKQKLMTSSAVTLRIVLFLVLRTFFSLYAAICCLPLVNGGHWAGDSRHLHCLRRSW